MATLKSFFGGGHVDATIEARMPKVTEMSQCGFSCSGYSRDLSRKWLRGSPPPRIRDDRQRIL